MATNRLLQDVATIFAPLGEDDQGQQRYDVYLLQRVSIQASSGTQKQQSSTTPDDTLCMYVFDVSSNISHYGEIIDTTKTCESIFYVIRDLAPTIDDYSKVYLVPYDASALTEPPPHSRRVSNVKRRKAGSNRRIWHWEVHAR